MAKAHVTLGDIEARLVNTPAEGMEGLVVKLENSVQHACTASMAFHRA